MELAAEDDAVLITEDNVELLDDCFHDWIGDVGDCDPFVAVVRGGRAISLCATVRTTDEADEAGVATHPDFRGEGHAGTAVRRWAEEVREGGREPLYSTSWENHASRSVASKLGLIQFGADLHLT